MKLQSLILIALLPITASAATFIIPAAGTGPGANGSHWQSEVTLHNTSASAVTVGLKFHDATGAQPADNVTINPRSTMTIPDIVRTRFGRDAATGAIEITVSDPNRIAITSRTFNGDFGQD